jgi:hypothetical protein
MKYSKRDLVNLDTIEQAWDGSELKIEENNIFDSLSINRFATLFKFL